jgi:hypothetical protein
MKKLSSLLPDTVPEASDTDDIHRIITKVHDIENTIGGTFIRHFDILFGNDRRDADGRLKNIRRGDHGMDCVIAYLESIHWESAGVDLEIASIKIARIVDELEYLWYVFISLKHSRSSPEHKSSTTQPPAGASSKSASKENVPPDHTNLDAQSKSRGPEWERLMDRKWIWLIS